MHGHKHTVKCNKGKIVHVVINLDYRLCWRSHWACILSLVYLWVGTRRKI